MHFKSLTQADAKCTLSSGHKLMQLAVLHGKRNACALAPRYFSDRHGQDKQKRQTTLTMARAWAGGLTERVCFPFSMRVCRAERVRVSGCAYYLAGVCVYFLVEPLAKVNLTWG